jgi:hypothetical protein
MISQCEFMFQEKVNSPSYMRAQDQHKTQCILYRVKIAQYLVAMV